jgi:hypothetical protein
LHHFLEWDTKVFPQFGVVNRLLLGFAEEKMSSSLSEMNKLVAKLFSRRDSEPFRDPVPHEALGLVDYLTIIKRPMDLNTVRQKLSANKYKSIHQAAADVRTIWANAMTYNMPDSKIYQIAEGLSAFFENAYSQIAKNDKDEPPSVEDMKAWAAKLYKLAPDQIGKLLCVLQKSNSECLSKDEDGSEIDLNVELISISAFQETSKMIQKWMPDLSDLGANGSGNKAPKRKIAEANLDELTAQPAETHNAVEADYVEQDRERNCNTDGSIAKMEGKENCVLHGDGAIAEGAH